MLNFMLFLDSCWSQRTDSQYVVSIVPEDNPDKLKKEVLFINWVQTCLFWWDPHEFFENVDGDVVTNFLFLHFQKGIEPLLIKMRRRTVLTKILVNDLQAFLLPVKKANHLSYLYWQHISVVFQACLFLWTTSFVRSVVLMLFFLIPPPALIDSPG